MDLLSVLQELLQRKNFKQLGFHPWIPPIQVESHAAADTMSYVGISLASQVPTLPES
jgi:hypothetical protein